MKSYVLFGVIALQITGCASTFVETKTTNFFPSDYKSEGSIVIVSAKPELSNSLEFMHYKAKIEEKLVKAGFVVKNSLEPSYVAFLAYGIDDGKNEISSMPIVGQKGGGTSYSSGTVYGKGGSASYSGYTYTMPSYGMVGTVTESTTVYTRVIAIDIVDAQSLKDGHPKKILESRARSMGGCSVIAGVFDEILEAMFQQFPGINGKPNTVNIHSKGAC